MIVPAGTNEGVIYVRISQDREGGGLAVARQEADCQALAVRLGLTVTQVYVDNDLSASSLKRPRPAYQALLEAITDGSVRTVLVWHTDRLHRQPTELETWIGAAERHGAVVQTVQAGNLDLATPSGRMVARMLGAAARYEVEHKIARQRAASEQAAAAGRRSGGGTRPYGYDKAQEVDSAGRVRFVLRIRETEAVVIREAASRILAGEPLRTVARDLTARGIPTVKGQEWYGQTLKRILVSGLRSGQREHQPRSQEATKRDICGPIVARGTWPAILTPPQTDLLRTVLTAPDRRLTPRVPRRCLLTGILVCHHCKKTLMGRPRGDGEMRYVCNRVPGSHHCGRTYVLAAPTDDWVTELIFSALDGPLLDEQLAKRQHASADDAALESQITQDRGRLTQLGRDYDDGLIDRAEWLERKARVEQRISEVEQRRLGRESALRLRAVRAAGPLAERWPSMSLGQRRAVITAVIDSITVGPVRRGYNRFDPDRFGEPVWRV